MSSYVFTREQLIRLMGRAAQVAAGTSWGAHSIAEEALAGFDCEDGAVRQYVMDDDDSLMQQLGID